MAYTLVANHVPLNADLIVEEWDNLQRIFVLLALKTTTQSIIVHKINFYARKNKTRQI